MSEDSERDVDALEEFSDCLMNRIPAGRNFFQNRVRELITTENVVTEDEVTDLYEELEAYWLQGPPDSARLCLTEEGSSTVVALMREIKGPYGVIIWLQCMRTYQPLPAPRLQDAEEEPTFKGTTARICQIAEAIAACGMVAVAAYRHQAAVDGAMLQYDMLPTYIYTLPESKAMVPRQRLIDALLSEFHIEGLRRMKDAVYCTLDVCPNHGLNPVAGEPMVPSFAWKRVGLIEEEVWRRCTKIINPGRWLDLTSSGDMARDVARYLENCTDPEFCDLVPNHKVFSGRDGLLFLDAEVYFDAIRETIPDGPVGGDLFVPYNSPKYQKLQAQASALVSLAYLDTNFSVRAADVPRSYRLVEEKLGIDSSLCEGSDDYSVAHAYSYMDMVVRSLPTPNFDRIFESQNIRDYTLERRWCAHCSKSYDEHDADGKCPDSISDTVFRQDYSRFEPFMDEQSFGMSLRVCHACNGTKVTRRKGETLTCPTCNVLKLRVPCTPAGIPLNCDPRKASDGVLNDRALYVTLAMLGRLLYEVNELDQMQVVLFIYGAAQSGKILLLNIMQSIIPDELVAVFSSEGMEQKFGLSALIGARMWACPEVKSKFEMPMGDFQSLVTGEKVSAAEKFKKPKMWKNTAHGFLVGNQIPAAWKQAYSMAVVRRVVQVHFPHKVLEREADTGLFKKIIGTASHPSELGYIVRKINACYRLFAQDWTGFETGLPKCAAATENEFWSLATDESDYFKAAQRKLKQQIDGLHNMLSGEGDAPTYFPMEGFICSLTVDNGIAAVYPQWRKDNGLPASGGWEPDSYMPVFQELKCRVSSLDQLGMDKSLPFVVPDASVTSISVVCEEVDLAATSGLSDHWCWLYKTLKERYTAQPNLLKLPGGSLKNPTLAAQNYVWCARRLSWPPPSDTRKRGVVSAVENLFDCTGDRCQYGAAFAEYIVNDTMPELSCPTFSSFSNKRSRAQRARVEWQDNADL